MEKRGRLRVYLGAAPGVGKTYAMLAEGQRRRARGTDVVAALIETHGRQLTTAMAEGLEAVPRRTMTYRGATFTEMDTDAILTRHPQVALVDELAHTNVPGCRNAKRWQDIEELLAAGIDVITTLNIQHLESLNDVTEQITGVLQQETLPDEVARRADQIELVDMTPEALRRRMAHGNVYPPDRIDAALTHYFRPGNLTALRELALLWLADRVEEGMQRYRTEHGIAAPWETRERIIVAVAGENDDEAVIRRAARVAARTPGSDLIAVHVTCDDGMASNDATLLETHRALVTSLGGSFCDVPGGDVADTLLAFARAENATQMVLGASRRSRLRTLVAGKSTPTRLARRAEHIDVHLVSRASADHGGGQMAWPLSALRRRRALAVEASAEAAALTRLAQIALRGRRDPPALLEEIREMFGLSAVSLLERRQDPGDGWFVVASAGERAPEGPGADVDLPISEAFTLAARGRTLSGQDKRVLFSCAVQIVAGLIEGRQDQRDAQAAARVTGPRSRAGLVAATTRRAHDLIAKAQMSLDQLADPSSCTPAENADLVASARLALDRVARLVTDVSDLSRLHAGALETYLRPVDLDEVIAACLEDLGPGGHHITLDTLEDLPDVIADAALLARVLTSLMADALHRSPADMPPTLTAAITGGQVDIRVTDRGAGPAQGNGSTLALRLARDLTEMMGGTFRCDRPSEGGRSVSLTLPAAGARSIPAAIGPDDQLAGANARTLAGSATRG
jgi:two-component system, OmpR family, sensor histidine kinase KdpD